MSTNKKQKRKQKKKTKIPHYYKKYTVNISKNIHSTEHARKHLTFSSLKHTNQFVESIPGECNMPTKLIAIYLFVQKNRSNLWLPKNR